MLLINDKKPQGHANIRPCIDRKGGVLFCLVTSVLMGGVFVLCPPLAPAHVHRTTYPGTEGK